MLRQDDFRQLIDTMMEEVNAHEDMSNWNISKQPKFLMEHFVNRRLLTILKIWQFKRKRFPDGSLLNHKARLCVH